MLAVKINKLMSAAYNGQLNAVKALIDEGIDVNVKDNNGDTALLYASFQGHKKIVNMLLENGVDINFRNSIGYNALFFASIKNHPSVVKLLIQKGSDVNKINKDGDSALSYAIIFKYYQIAKLLICNGGYLHPTDEKVGMYNFLLWTINNDFSITAKNLLEKNFIKTKSYFLGCESLLSAAEKKGNSGIIKILKKVKSFK